MESKYQKLKLENLINYLPTLYYSIFFISFFLPYVWWYDYDLFNSKEKIIVVKIFGYQDFFLFAKLIILLLIGLSVRFKSFFLSSLIILLFFLLIFLEEVFFGIGVGANGMFLSNKGIGFHLSTFVSILLIIHYLYKIFKMSNKNENLIN
ncbi:MAG: hypothetical protein FGM14_16010 [Flavobacteriales bacterium]|nr:hypothetical protein [Flavobacteriales bacterium]